MKNTFVYLRIILLFLFFSISTSVVADKSFDNIYIFGDSISDTGNLASVLGFTLPSPPFYESSRISNGPVSVEVLAQKLGLNANPSLHLTGPEQGTNYAVAGGRAAADATDPRSLAIQMNSFFSNHPNGVSNETLFVMFIGGNDVRDALDFASISESKNHIDLAIENVKNALNALLNAGAEHILIVNSPNVGTTPETSRIALETGDPDYRKRAIKLSKFYNKQLKKVRKKLKRKNDAKFYKFNLFKYANFIIKKGKSFGFENVTDACFNTDEFVFFEICDNGANFSKFIFFDELHFTARVHKLIGNEMARKFLSDNDDDDDDDDDDD